MPAILLKHVITPTEAIDLFDLYFERCSVHTGLLTVEFHTPQLVASRSPFLFTVICAIASRYYTKNPQLYNKVMDAAQELAVSMIKSSFKSVEIMQGFLMLANWSKPAVRYEEDRTWTYTGIAIRMGQELGLFRKVQSQVPEGIDPATKLQYEREILNRERTWIYCFVSRWL